MRVSGVMKKNGESFPLCLLHIPFSIKTYMREQNKLYYIANQPVHLCEDVNFRTNVFFFSHFSL